MFRPTPTTLLTTTALAVALLGSARTGFADPINPLDPSRWVTVGDAGNAPDASNPVGSFGAVPYEYRIMKYEWTNSQYVSFLNAVDPEGLNSNGIYNEFMGTQTRGGISRDTGATAGSRYAVRPNMGDKPVNYVSWFAVARVSNWLQAGAQTYGSSAAGAAAIDNGAYTLGGSTTGVAPAKTPVRRITCRRKMSGTRLPTTRGADRMQATGFTLPKPTRCPEA